MKITVALIVKNEKDHIETVLESVRGADEIIVCDTGSTDNTVDLAKKYTDKIYTDYTWNDDFAEARNHALSKSTGDWVLSIDADEYLEEGGVEKIRQLIQNTTNKTFKVKLQSKGQIHHSPRLFINDRTVKWVGKAHETLSVIEDNKTDVQITYGYSTAHQLDPDRMLRILQKSVDETPTSARDLYYLAREHYYRKDYPKAIEVFEECLKYSKWNPERADTHLYIARSSFYSGQGDKARTHCLQAININPDFKEALLFMGVLHYSPWKEKWLQIAQLASNKDVLFVRSQSTVQSKIPKKLHHIWVGPKEAPAEWMNTWKEKNPDWEYTLWDNEKVFGRKWINQKHIDYYRERQIWHGVADVVRYEILWEQGGFMPGADSVCLEPIDELFTDGFDCYGVYENEKVRPGLISPLYAAKPGCEFAKQLIDGLSVKEEVGEPWIHTGNKYMQEMVDSKLPPMKIFPSYIFNPIHYTGETYQGKEKVYGKQMWGTTLNKY